MRKMTAKEWSVVHALHTFRITIQKCYVDECLIFAIVEIKRDILRREFFYYVVLILLVLYCDITGILDSTLYYVRSPTTCILFIY
jgi:hypothetical protein